MEFIPCMGDINSLATRGVVLYSVTPNNAVYNIIAECTIIFNQIYLRSVCQWSVRWLKGSENNRCLNVRKV